MSSKASHHKLPMIIVAALSVLSGGAAALVSMVSLTRIAQDQLGFPQGLPWTFTAAADIGAAAGAVMWTVSPPETSTRRTGVALNIFCLTVSAVCVGLDHAHNAAPSWAGWAVAAFAVGVFIPLLGSWMVHGVAKMAWPEPPMSAPAVSSGPVKVADVPAEQPPTEQASAEQAPVPVVLTKTAPSELKEHQQTSMAAIDWARQNWPATARDVMDATKVRKGSAHRIVNQVREEMTGT